MKSEKFWQDGYLKLPGYIGDGLLRFLQTGFYVNKDILVVDTHVKNSIFHYNHPLSKTLLVESVETVSNLIGEEVIPTCSYTRLYKKGSELPIHRDRPACEISLSLSIDYSCDANQNPLYFSKTPNKNDGDGVILNKGDACLYKGCEMYHWREKIDYDWHLQVFLHFVKTNGENKHHAWDQYD